VAGILVKYVSNRSPEQKALAAFAQYGIKAARRAYRQATGCSMKESREATDKAIQEWHNRFRRES
jgi:hypothetical protein